MSLFKRRLAYKTTKPKEQVIAYIRNNISYSRNLNPLERISWKNADKTYRGYVTKDEFYLRRILTEGANSFIPLVSGVIIDKGDRRIIKVELALPLFTRAFTIIFCAFNLVLLFLLIGSGYGSTLIGYSPLLVMVGAIALVHYMFAREVNSFNEFMKPCT